MVCLYTLNIMVNFTKYFESIYLYRLHNFVLTFVPFLLLAAPDQPREPTPEELEDKWDDISGELSTLIQGRGELPTDVTPFDAASEVDIDHQR